MRRAERVSQLFEQALELLPDERAGFLDDLALRDAAAHAQLQVLLASHAAAPDYLDRLAGRVVPAVLRGVDDDGLLDPYVGRTVGRYRVIERIGAGGMGVVYRALDPTLNRHVALKFLSPHLGADPRARTRLIAEARAASALDHPNIAVIHEIGSIPAADGESGQDRLFIAMAYHAGRTLRQILAEGAVALPEALDYATQLASGLARAHAAGIVHRDLKPANVIVAGAGAIRIVDFGIAKLRGLDVTREGTTPGTIAYMSPEQIRGGAVDARTDVWSTGVLLYEMIAGVRPFRGDDDAVVIQAIRNDEPVPLRIVRPDVPPALERLVERCLQKDAAARFPDAGALHDTLEDVRAQLDRNTGAPSVPGFLTTRRRRILFGAALALTSLAVLLFVRPRPQAVAPVAPAPTILVLPFVSPPGDTALARLGRDLAVTMSATLDGIGDLRTIDPSTVFAHLHDDGGEAAIDPDRGRQLAAQLGAGRVLVGSLVIDGAAVRADARILTADGVDVLVRASGAAPADSLVALTDTLTLRLVRGLWAASDRPVPSLGALTTRSVAALRAYVDGEQALASGAMERAVDAFERAFAADPGFWYAYWRSLYPRVYEGARADTAVMAEILRHRDELPERDRMLIEARMERTVRARQEALKAVVERHPSYWPAAWDLANLQFHWTPPLGTRMVDSRESLERVVALNPRFVTAWHHLLIAAAFLGDTARAHEALSAMERLTDPADLRWESGVIIGRTLLDALENDGIASPEQEDAMANVMQRLALQVPGASWGLATTFMPFGLAGLQIRLNRRVLAAGPLRAHAADLLMGNAVAWAARGAWDSAAVELDAWRRTSTDPRDALRAYGLGILGMFVGGWDMARVEALAAAAVDAAVAGDADDRAERAWLDGVFAFARTDTTALEGARGRIRRSGGSANGSLDRSLAAFEQALRGDEAAAARTLERLELDDAERWASGRRGSRHPYLGAVNRLHAGRWLLGAGDTAAVVRIHQWWQAAPGTRDGGRETPATWVVVPFVLVEQARIARARGHEEEAARHYRRIISLYDRPSAPQGIDVLAEARAALGATTDARRQP